MPRKYSKRQRKMRGGQSWLDYLLGRKDTPSLTSSMSSTPSMYNSSMSSTPSMSGTPSMSTTTSASRFGGKRRSRKMRGGFESNAPTGLVVYAAPFSGPTAEPQTKVGGRTRRRGRKSGRKSHRRH